MPPSQPVTETIILRLKKGVNLENAACEIGGSISAAVQEFIQLTNTVNSQQGFIRQLWGHQVEDQRNFVWSIDWESFEHSTTFVNSEDYSSFIIGMGHVFDLETAAPLTMYTRFTSSAFAALAAPVTEIAFFTVPNSARETAKPLIETAVIESTHPVIAVGGSFGGAIGWVFETKNATDAAPDGESIALHGVFGYASVDDHVRWRETAEHAEVVERMGKSPLGRLGLGDARVPGGNVFVSDSSMFHVRFRAGI